MNNTIDRAARELMGQDAKVGILATLDDGGYPHLTFLSSLQAHCDKGVTFGSFCTGLSKEFIQKRPETAFLILSPDMRWLRGNARFTHTETTGDTFDEYNNKPLFRYNSYFGFNTIFFMDLIGISDIFALPMQKIIAGALASRLRAPLEAKNAKGALRHTGKALFDKIDGLKFLCYEKEKGCLHIIPIIQASSAGTDRVVFSGTPYGDELKAVPVGGKASILCLNLEMQSVLVKGRLIKAGLLDIERVYNSMPVKNRYIYPMEAKPVAVTDFT